MDYYDPHPTLQLERALALVGFMGAGVGAVAHGLSARTGLPLFDLPRQVESRAGMSWARLLLERGPETTAQAEHEALAQSLRDGAPGVIALSHGALLHDGIRSLVAAQTHLIYIHRPIETLFTRILTQLQNNPTSIPEFMLAAPGSPDDLAPYLAEREPGYQTAHSTLMARDLHNQQIVDTLLNDLRTTPTT